MKLNHARQFSQGEKILIGVLSRRVTRIEHKYTLWHLILGLWLVTRCQETSQFSHYLIYVVLWSLLIPIKMTKVKFPSVLFTQVMETRIKATVWRNSSNWGGIFCTFSALYFWRNQMMILEFKQGSKYKKLWRAYHLLSTVSMSWLEVSARDDWFSLYHGMGSISTTPIEAPVPNSYIF